MTRTEAILGVAIVGVAATGVYGAVVLLRAHAPTRARGSVAAVPTRAEIEPIDPPRGSPGVPVALPPAPAGGTDPTGAACLPKPDRIAIVAAPRIVDDGVPAASKAPPPPPPEAMDFRERALSAHEGDSLAEISAKVGRPPERTVRTDGFDHARWTARDGALFFATIDPSTGRAVAVELRE